jgi:hypothetical protein
MPVVGVLSLVKSPPTNAFGLVQYLSQRLPGYDPSEHLRELNSAYIHVWEEITKLKNHYFTNIVRVTTVTAQYQYDLMFNADSALSGAVSPRLYQVTKLRFMAPGSTQFSTSRGLSPNDPDFVEINSASSANPSQAGPYRWFLSGRNQLNMGLPLAVGTVIEVTYTFWPIALAILSAGVVSSAANVVTGVSTNFTNLVQPDYQSMLPNLQAQEEIQAELICNPTVELGGQVYRVTKIISDTIINTKTNVGPALAAGSPYALATLPEIPREHIRVVAALALKNMYSVAGDDTRSGEWTAIYEKNIQMMKDALEQRQSNNPATKIRFPGSLARRNQAWMR